MYTIRSKLHETVILFIYIWPFITMHKDQKCLKATELDVPTQLLPTSHKSAQKGAQNGKTGNSTRKRQEKSQNQGIITTNYTLKAE